MMKSLYYFSLKIVKVITILTISSLLFYNIIYATPHYVDNNANGSNNGSSWLDAWESFADINWNNIQSGDVIYISGGSLSQTYTSELSIGTSGFSGTPVIITKGIDTNHNGEVILNGSGIRIRNISFITVSNLTINGAGTAIKIDGSYSNATHDIIIDNCDGEMSGRFIHVEGYPDLTGSYCHNITIKNCDSFTPSSTGNQNDFVYAQYMGGLIVENCSVNIASNDASQHNDCIQTYYVDGPVIVRNNYFEHSDTKTRNSQGIFIENHEGDYYVYNNIIVMPNSLDGKIYWKSRDLNDAHTFIYSNTVYGCSGSLIKTTDPNAVIKNNILFSTGYQPTGSSYMLEFNEVSGNSADVSNNLFYDPAGNMNNMNSGTNQNGVEGNPLFNNISTRDFTLQTNSPAIDKGEYLGAPYNVDRNGNPRSNPPDIGAYEFMNNNGNYIPINTGWNVISIPKLSENMTADYLLPTRTSTVFGYNGNGYQNVYNLQNGKGYIVKFGYPQYIFIEGDSVFFPIQVNIGWNLIGPFNQNVPVTQIYTVPSGILISNFYGITENGYFSTDVLEIGKGYWINSVSNGQIILNGGSLEKNGMGQQQSAEIDPNWGKIKITDGDGKSITLYSAGTEIKSDIFGLPPLPPAGIFDVRYSSGRFVENLSTDNVIMINSDKYPLKIKVEDISIFLRDRINGEIINTELNDGDEITITNEKITSLVVVGKMTEDQPVSYQLYQNYPNPFNPGTQIKYSVPQTSQIQIKVFDVLGNEIETLVNEEKPTGTYELTWNAAALPSGIYFYRIQAGSFVNTKKMILLK